MSEIYKKKPRDPKLNILFIKWVDEMKKEAKKTGNQSYFSFKKALNSIKKFPLPLKSGKDCLILEGFGEKICSSLDKKLAELAHSKGLSLRKALRFGNKELVKNLKDNPIKTYLPKNGSSCYAIIMGLHELYINNNLDDNGFKKKEIQEVSKKYCTDFDMNNEGVSISWTNMKTLINEDVVIKSSKSYKLSQNGINLYNKLNELSKAALRTPSIEINIENKLELYYCKSLEPFNHELVNRKSHAAYKMFDNKKYFRIKVKQAQLKFQLDYKYDFDASFVDEEFIIIFLADKDAPKEGLRITKSKNEPSNLSSAPIIQHVNKIMEPKTAIIIQPKKVNELPLPLMTEDVSPPLFTMDPDSFEIVLVVDTRENFGTGKLKEVLCPKLSSNGVTIDIRPLPVGDFLWIAKDKFGREAVLDIIVERKRFDDLCASIMDNRFKDQKLRMKRLGISRILYLVEKCPNMRNLKIDLVTLYQNLVNSEINDNCDVKITESGPDTIAYLTLLTKKLQKIYKNQSISVYDNFNCVNNEKLNPFDQNSLKFYGLDFNSFSQTSQKTKPLKISEMFAKHLMSIHGITPEKAKAVISLYNTPRQLMDAYDKCGTEKTSYSLLSDIKISGGKKFGIVSSKSIYYSYCRK